MKLLFIYIFLILLIFSCKSEKSVTGLYKNSKPTIKEYAFFETNSKYSVTNSTLAINKDSSFILKSCGMISYGKWSVNSNNLSLNTTKAFSLSDTIQPIKNNVKDFNYNFKIFKNSLIAKRKLFEDNKTDVLNKFVLQ
ncbi:hypothetical protein [Aurantibacter aestuarii]|uniref:DUF306 domain-containing protein n=1 Tax=Aurantibacter aestuarii TaxID=1266046 RepID=A0A2T1NEC6_9FLAO|nr:hypothetical protein [Aurantibacter aestuarii]PSG90780.1 hypothetical protein C7H52_05765 [Aurantibacter aestuarii]